MDTIFKGIETIAIRSGISFEFLQSDCNLPGFTYTHTPTEGEKGGVLLYVPDNLIFVECPKFDALVYKSKELESKFIELSQSNNRSIVVGCIYKHPRMSVNEFNNNFLIPFLTEVSSCNKDIILLGDFNVDLLKSDTVKEVCEYLDIFSSFNLLPQIILPTRVTETTSTVIDNIFFNSAECNPISGNIICPISDHLAQFAVMQAPQIQYISAPDEKIARDWKNFNHADFLTELRSAKWDVILQLEANDPNISFDNLHNSVNNLLDKYAPFKITCKKKNRKKSNPWITNGILVSISKRDHLYKSYIREKSPVVKALLLESFKKYRNKIVSLCRLSKSNFFTKYFRDNKKHIGKIWEGVKSIISLRSSSSSSSLLLVLTLIMFLFLTLNQWQTLLMTTLLPLPKISERKFLPLISTSLIFKKSLFPTLYFFLLQMRWKCFTVYPLLTKINLLDLSVFPLKFFL